MTVFEEHVYMPVECDDDVIHAGLFDHYYIWNDDWDMLEFEEYDTYDNFAYTKPAQCIHPDDIQYGADEYEYLKWRYDDMCTYYGIGEGRHMIFSSRRVKR